MTKKVKPISSAKQAVDEAGAMSPGCSGYGCSNESYLALRTLIYCAELLERIAAQKPQKNRKPSAWQVFMGQQMSKGRSVQEAAGLWQSRKEKTA